MQTILVFALLGLGSGAVIAAVAIGVVLSWRGTGSFNLAAGASVMVSGYIFWAFRTGFFRFSLGTWPAVIATLAFMVVYAVVVELLAVKPLRTASPLAKLVASLGILLLTQAMVQLIFGTAPLASPAVLTDDVIVIGDVPVPVAQLILAGGVSLLAIGLWAVYRFTHFGMATRASSENEVSALLSGLEPSSISLVNSILANLAAGAVGIAAAPIVGISATTIPLLIVPALAAALFARFTSFAIACAAGLAIGVGESLIFYASTQPWFPSHDGTALSGLQQLVVFVLIVVALWWRGSSLPQRGDLRGTVAPARPQQDHLARRMLPVVAACAVALVVLPSEFRQAVVTGLVGTVLCLSFIVIMGYVGQLSVVQLALAGIAGFGVARLSFRFGVGFPLGPLIAIVVALIVGVVVGVSALRVRGVTLVVVTLASAVAIEKFVFADPDWGGGTTGITVEQPSLFGIELGTNAGFRGLDGSLPSPVFGLCALLVTAALYAFVANLRRGELGRRMLAVRSNERAAAAAGVNVRQLKIYAFAISSALAGVAGVLFAYDFGTVSASMFDVMTALSVVASVYVLGVTVVQGAVLAGFGMVGAVVPLIMQKWLLPADRVGFYVQLIIGAGLLIQLRFYPDGILIASATKRERRLAERRQSSTTSAVQSLERRGRGMTAPALAARELSVRYGGVRAVSNVSLEVPEGTIVGLIGPNGAGKTTLVDAIAGFVPCDGRVEIGGEDVTRMKPHARRAARSRPHLAGGRAVRRPQRGGERGGGDREPVPLGHLHGAVRQADVGPSACLRSARRGRDRAPRSTRCRPSSRKASASWWASHVPSPAPPVSSASTSRLRGSTRPRPVSWGCNSGG